MSWAAGRGQRKRMARLFIHVEGQTEETFVNEVLSPYLYNQGYISVSARQLGNARLRKYRGGIRPWGQVKKEILNHLQEDSNCIVTTMVDYYGLPQDPRRGWPGRAEAGRASSAKEKAECVELALLNDLAGTRRFDSRRFVPFVTMHEFEGLLFSDCDAFGRSIEREDLILSLQNIRANFTTPEDINDSPEDAPSKRIERLIPDYEKPLFGTLIVLSIPLEKIIKQCPHFQDWLRRLTGLLDG